MEVALRAYLQVRFPLRLVDVGLAGIADHPEIFLLWCLSVFAFGFAEPSHVDEISKLFRRIIHLPYPAFKQKREHWRFLPVGLR